ncbi:MAG: serine hydrolase [Terriglobia bacterium]|jgi:CubicO group peptidase (beta-lactamase class C family)/D-alanyl-D-alanine dipeptidase
MALGVRQKTTLFMMAACLALLGWVSIHGSLRELLAVLPNSANVAPRGDYAEVVQALTPLIEHELKEKGIPSIAVALVDDQQVVWAQGFGSADPEHKVDATAGTVYRVGSVSKLFTDIGIMQLVEQGMLSLDAPVTDYISDFHPQNPFGKPITLRELMSHRSGLVREPPVGHYFDSHPPGLADVVHSLKETSLVYAPGAHTKYSNAGITVVGYVLQQRAGQPFAPYLKSAVLEPMGLHTSGFEPTPDLTGSLAKADIWTYDGRIFPAPTFEIGIFPAGSLYTTVTDLAQFESVLFAGGRGPSGPVVSKATMDEMWTPQFSTAAEPGRFGIGFALGKLDGHRMVGHDGAIYGFATSLDALPDDKLGAVAVATLDSSNGVTDHIVTEALKLMLAARDHKTLPAVELTTPLDPSLARHLAGQYGRGPDAFDLDEHEGRLFMQRMSGGFQREIRSLGGNLIVDDRLYYGTPLNVVDHAIQVGSTKLAAVDSPRPAPPPQAFENLIGEYGWDYDTLYVLEKDGHLEVLIEWYEYAPLTQASRDVFQFPDYGLYDREQATFERDAHGAVTGVKIGWVEFKRRPGGIISAGVFHVQPLKPVDELRRDALAAHPPTEDGDFLKPDLVELVKLDPTIKLDIRYASTRNFLSSPMYQQARAFMQRPAAEAVVRANQKLHALGYGLMIHDAYRPWYVTKMFWDAVPDPDHNFVADPSQGSRHNRGCAVDLTVYDLKSGRAVPMVSGYDEMTERAYPFYPGGNSLERWDRALLRHAMEDEGLTVYEDEWWHFDYKDWRKYPILNVAYEKIH